MTSVVYFLRRASDGAIKIGHTTDYHTRLATLRAEHGEMELLGLMDAGRIAESSLHFNYDRSRIGKTEFFKDDGIFGRLSEKSGTPPVNNPVL